MLKPLAIYIHWPFCKSKCPYCDFNSHVRDAVDHARWKKALLAELHHMASHVSDREVASIFFGGGTPSLMQADTAGALIEEVHTLWPTAHNIEITLEANPTSVEANTFPEFKAAGINRVSLGVQSFDNSELKFLGREHSAHEAKGAIDLARNYFDRYSFDLIYARPHQTLATWKRELSEALPMTGGHLSLYQLTIEENTAFAHAYKNGGFTLPDEETSEALYLLTEEMAYAHGLRAYEVSNYAKPGQESRHNLAYWRGTDYIGIGPGAHGRITKDGKRIATATLKSPERWLSQVEEKNHAIEIWQEVNRHVELEERLMMGLRLTEGIALAPFAEIIDEKKRQLFIAQGLLENHPDKLQPTLKGRLLLTRLTAELLKEM
jgi:putative oxygen-independent coproporphyrinogen III oxidase